MTLSYNHCWPVNTTPFSVEDKQAIKVLSLNNCYGANCLFKMFSNKLCKSWTLGWLKTLIQKTDARSFTVTVNVVWVCVHCLTAHCSCCCKHPTCWRSYVEPKQWSRFYKFVLSLKNDKINTHCDILILFLFLIITLRHCAICATENICSVSMLRLNLYFQRIFLSFSTILVTFSQNLVWLWRTTAAITNIDTWLRQQQRKVQWFFFMVHSVVLGYNCTGNDYIIETRRSRTINFC